MDDQLQDSLEEVLLKQSEDQTVSDIVGMSIDITGLAEILCSQLQETIEQGEFFPAQNLAWSYKCLAHVAINLADRLTEISV